MTPRATYRLQFGPQFGFADAAQMAPYLARLGVSHVYASPIFKARAGSTHGYDVVDYNAIDPRLGGLEGFMALHDTLEQDSIGIILDFVPNHMGVIHADNAWWNDVLAWGQRSPFAACFDIHWPGPDAPHAGQVVLPVLDHPLAVALANRELRIVFNAEEGAFAAAWHDHRFPLTPPSYAVLLRRAARRCGQPLAQGLERWAAAFAELPERAPHEATQACAGATGLARELAGHAAMHPALHDACAWLSDEREELGKLLQRQHWRLVDWRQAAEQINYRRFFDINDLAAVRVEDPRVFDLVHGLVLQLLDDGLIDGLRIDHIDGLWDPLDYLRRLRARVGPDAYLVVEKILAQDEALPPAWPIAGTTGYDFMNQVTRWLVDGRAEQAMTRCYAHFIDEDVPFGELLYHAKRQVIRRAFCGELRALGSQLEALIGSAPASGQGSGVSLAGLLADITACFPVYRSYVDAHGASNQDLRWINEAVALARQRNPDVDTRMLDDVAAALAGSARGNCAPSAQALPLARRYQQFSAPVMAKGLEDTALYRYHRLIALCDVGGDPRDFALSPSEFHAHCAARSSHWPQAMLTTATHDTKRGEDVRARLAALPALAEDWRRAVQAWTECSHGNKQRVDGALVPGRNAEYLLYQTLLGSWPPHLMRAAPDTHALAAYVQRIQEYMTKAAREAKRDTSWRAPNVAYEQALCAFVQRIIQGDARACFMATFAPLQARLAELGVDNSLAQLALKLTCPGVPDVYRGCELWDWSLVDPDNRRAVDFARRDELLQRVLQTCALPPPERSARLRAWRSNWHGGAIKMYVLHRLLALRRDQPRLFSQGSYLPLDAGADTGKALCFQRRLGALCLTVAVRPAGAGSPLPALAQPATEWLTGASVQASADVAALLQQGGLPVAILLHGAPGDARHD